MRGPVEGDSWFWETSSSAGQCSRQLDVLFIPDMLSQRTFFAVVLDASRHPGVNIRLYLSVLTAKTTSWD